MTFELNHEERELLLKLLDRAERNLLAEFRRTESIPMHRALDHDEDILRGIIEKLRLHDAATASR